MLYCCIVVLLYCCIVILLYCCIVVLLYVYLIYNKVYYSNLFFFELYRYVDM